MIPARIGSQRVKLKNIRLINGKPLISYIIESAIKANIFDEIYINSDSDIFKEIAKKYNISFYKRPDIFATNTASNDDFVNDFLSKINCNYLIQLLPTSPFISPLEINQFVEKMINDNYNTLVSVLDVQIECMYKNTPINFDLMKHTPPSQTLEPIKAYACGIMGWKKTNYIENMEKYDCAYHGGKGKIGYFPLKGFSTVDIDNEEDFILAEAIVNGKKSVKNKPKYYETGSNEDFHIEVDVPDILSKDGVVYNDLFDVNLPKVCVNDIIKLNSDKKSWSKRIVDTESNSAVLICQMPGEGNRSHYHPDWNEWWYIIKGEWMWEVEGEKMIVQTGDVVFIKKGLIHKITATGSESAIRLAVSRSDVPHYYPMEK
jgi:CMP-N,N'-diacetyllegionaminic acid synthase